jgi:hypothetical protein
VVAVGGGDVGGVVVGGGVVGGSVVGGVVVGGGVEVGGGVGGGLVVGGTLGGIVGGWITRMHDAVRAAPEREPVPLLHGTRVMAGIVASKGCPGLAPANPGCALVPDDWAEPPPRPVPPDPGP